MYAQVGELLIVQRIFICIQNTSKQRRQFKETQYGWTLEWIPNLKITEIESTHVDNVCYAFHKNDCTMIMLVLLGSDEVCTATFVSELLA